MSISGGAKPSRLGRRLAVVLAVAALLGAGGEPPREPAAAPETPAAAAEKPVAATEERALSDELASVLTRLREERAASYRRQNARGAEIKAAREPLRRLESELAELKAREEETDKELAGVAAQSAALREAQAAFAASEAGLAAALDHAVAAAKALIAQGFDYRREERLARLGAQLPPEADLAERVTRYWAFLQEELRIARSGEAYTSQVPLDGGRIKPARLFRVGHLVQGFVTEDGLESGLETPAGWERAVDPETDRVVRAAIDILDRRRAPALLRVPIRPRSEP